MVNFKPNPIDDQGTTVVVNYSSHGGVCPPNMQSTWKAVFHTMPRLWSVEFFIQHLCHSSLNPSVAMKAKYALNYVRYVEHEKMNLKTCFRSVCEER